MVVKNGYHAEREILTGIGPVAVKVPEARSRTKEAALPWLYLKGIFTGQM